MSGPLDVSVKTEVSSETADEVFSTALETVSPLTELGGAFGDLVRAGRMEIGNQICRRAAQIAQQNGYKLKAPPLKFMRQFFDVATLEEQEDLHGAWANLLIRAGKDQDKLAFHMFCTDVLSKIDMQSMLSYATVLHIAPDSQSREKLAGLLDNLCETCVRDKTADDIQTKEIASETMNALRSLLTCYDERIAEYEINGEKVNNNGFVCLNIGVKFDDGAKPNSAGTAGFSPEFKGKRYTLGRSAVLLPAVFGLLEVYDHEFRKVFRHMEGDVVFSASVSVVTLTELGKRFAKACNIKGLEATKELS
ncbi:MAG: hypothetical protein ACI9PY_002938 [Ascidiaceihabitans sp.]|jgi:hypothetical protein